ncbi:MAG: hypothetical protein R3F55_00280 [Alphaproteobacteria bacterium]
MRPATAVPAGHDVVAVDPVFGRAGIARDRATGDHVLWAVEDGAYWPDRDGAPVPVDPALLAHGTLEPGNVASVLAAMVELGALAGMPLEAADGTRAAAQALLGDGKDPKHPLHPFLPLLDRSLPEIWKRAYSGAYWSNRQNRRDATDLATQVAGVLGNTLHDPQAAQSAWGARPAPTPDRSRADPRSDGGAAGRPAGLGRLYSTSEEVVRSESPIIGDTSSATLCQLSAIAARTMAASSLG